MEHKIEILNNTPKTNEKKTSDEMTVGDIAVITKCEWLGYGGEVIVRAYDSLVSLSNPQHVWTPAKGPNFGIQIVHPGAKVVIETPLKHGSLDDRLIQVLLNASEKILAIKYVRTITSWGLKEAKDYVDNVQANPKQYADILTF